MLMAISHIFMPKYFDWKNDFKNLSLFNKQMVKTHTFFIALTVFGIGFLSFFESAVLIQTILGKKIALGFGIFWVFRLFFQLFIYSSKLWKGKTFETIVHIILTLFWIYASSIYLIVAFFSDIFIFE